MTAKEKKDEVIQQNDEKIDALKQAGGDPPEQVKAAEASLELQNDKEEAAVGLGDGPISGALAGDPPVEPKPIEAEPLKVELVNKDGEDLGDHGLAHFDDSGESIDLVGKSREELGLLIAEGKITINQARAAYYGEDEGEDDLFTFHGETGEGTEFEPEEDMRAYLHGSHSAAMGGLQTDASGSYTPPGIAESHKHGSTFKQ